MRRKDEPCIVATKRYYLYCEECQQNVHASCVTQEWHDHRDNTKCIGHEDYKRVYVCPYCGAYIGCRKGTYTPIHGHIPSNSQRKGREYVINRIKAISLSYHYRRDEIAQCLGFSTINSVKVCYDVEKLRHAYLVGLALEEELVRLEGKGKYGTV